MRLAACAFTMSPNNFSFLCCLFFLPFMNHLMVSPTISHGNREPVHVFGIHHLSWVVFSVEQLGYSGCFA